MTSAKRVIPARDFVYTQLRRSIVMSHYEPGERLSPLALADAFGVSVTPVREALQILDQEGLVITKPRSGYFVTRLTLKELMNWLEVREVLEVAAIERAATRISEEQLRELEEAHAGYSGDDDESVERYITENKHLHCLIAEASGNHTLAELLCQVHDRLARFIAMGHSGGIMREFRHQLLIDALRARDPVRARQAMLDELANVRRMVLENVIQEEGAAWQLGAQHQPAERIEPELTEHIVQAVM